MDASRRLSRLLASLVIVVAVAAPAKAQNTGVLLFTDKEQISLKTYAEFMRSGILRITSGAVKDIPTIDSFRFIRCSRTGWRPVSVMVASGDLFKSEYSERRLIPIAHAAGRRDRRHGARRRPRKSRTDRRTAPRHLAARRRRRRVLFSRLHLRRPHPVLPVQDARGPAVIRFAWRLRRRHDAVSVVAESTTPPMLSTITTMSHSGRR